MEEKARRAYETYAQSLGIDKMPGAKTWDMLPEQRKNAWRAVAASLAPESTPSSPL